MASAIAGPSTLVLCSRKLFFMSRPFLKMHGLGNDFVIFDGRKDGFIPDTPFCLRIADRHRGIGYDQLIVMSPAQDASADLYMHIFNADGSEAELVGMRLDALPLSCLKKLARKKASFKPRRATERQTRNGVSLFR